MAGLPNVQRVKRDAMKAEVPQVVEQPQNVVIPLNPPSEPPKIEVVETPPTLQEPPKPSVEDELRAENAKLEQRYRSLQGVIEKLEPEVRSEREQRAKLEQEMVKLREALPQPINPDEELTEEELATYGESSPVIQKIAKKIARGELSAAVKELKKEIAELKEASSKIQTDLTQTSEEQFLGYVKSVIKNFDTIVASKEWSEYLGSRAPYSRKSIHDLLTEAHMNRDADTIKEIFEGFKPSKSALASMVTPTLGAGSAPPNLNGTQKPILKWSDRQKISRDFKFGRIDQAEKSKWDKLFKEAEAENRIDYSK